MRYLGEIIKTWDEQGPDGATYCCYHTDLGCGYEAQAKRLATVVQLPAFPDPEMEAARQAGLARVLSLSRWIQITITKAGNPATLEYLANDNGGEINLRNIGQTSREQRTEMTHAMKYLERFQKFSQQQNGGNRSGRRQAKTEQRYFAIGKEFYAGTEVDDICQQFKVSRPTVHRAAREYRLHHLMQPKIDTGQRSTETI